MSFEAFIAKRYFQFTGNRPPLLTFLIKISLISIAVSVFALITVLSVMEGFEQDFQKRILGFRAPLLVITNANADLSAIQSEILKINAVTKAIPFIEGEAIIQARHEMGMTGGMRIKGIDEKPNVLRLGQLMETKPFGETSLILGDELASSLRMHPDFNEVVTLIFPLGEVGPAGDYIPRVRKVDLTGLFHSGYYDFDHKYGILPYPEARKLLGAEGKQGLEVWFPNIHETAKVKNEILKKGFENIKIETWSDQNPKLFSALRLEKIGMTFLLSVLLLVASFNIFSVISLTVVEKRKDMGLLKGLGLRSRRIQGIFLAYALRLALWGGGIGGLLGVIFVSLGIKYPIRLPETYYIETLPLSFSLPSIIFVLMLVPLITLGAAYYPALKASETDPIDALQREELS